MRLLKFTTLILSALCLLPIAATAAYSICPGVPGVVRLDYGGDDLGLAVPLPALATWVGADIAVDADGSITVTRKGVSLVCRVDDKKAACDGKPLDLPFVPFEKFGVVFVPLNPFIVSAWGGTTTVDSVKNEVTVTLPGMPPATLYYIPGNGDPDLYSMRQDGSETMRITYDGQGCYELSISADGSYFQYQTNGKSIIRRADDPLGWRVPLAISSYIRDFTFMSDNKLVVYWDSTGEPGQIMQASLDGSYAKILATADDLLVSPDGQLLLFRIYHPKTRHNDIMAMQSDGSKRRKLNLNNCYPIAISNDCTTLLCFRDYKVPGQKEEVSCPLVYMLAGPSAGACYEQPAGLRTVDQRCPAISPDGGKVVFPRGNDIWISDITLRKSRPLAKNVLTGYPIPIKFSPDGMYIYYTKFNSPLYRLRVDGSEREERVTPPGYLVSDFCFAPDQRMLVGMGCQMCSLPPSPPDALRINGELMAPLGTLMSSIGTHSFFAPYKSYSIDKFSFGNSLSGTIGSTAAMVNHKTALTLPVAPVSMNGEIYFPLEATMTALGYSVNVDEKRQVVSVSTPAGSQTQARAEMPIIPVDDPQKLWTKDNSLELYAMYPNGTLPVRLTFDTEENALPTFTADERSYSYLCHDKKVIRPTYFAAPPTPRELTFAVDPKATFAAGKRYLTSPCMPQGVEVRDGGLWLTEKPGANPRMLVKGDKLSKPSFTLDGGKIVYFDGASLYAISLDGLSKTRLAPNLRISDYTFAPNGMIFFVANSTE